MQLEKDGPPSNESGRCPVSAVGGEFNPFVDPYLADPYPFWRTARRTEPVFYSPELDYWVVTCFDDIKAIFADPESFSAGNAQHPITPLAPEVVELLSGGLKTKPTMSNADPPEHTRIRKSTWTAFGPKRVAQLEPEVRRIVTRYLDEMQEARSADLVHEMFYDLPVLVLFLFLGMPAEDVARVKSWSRNRLLLTWGRLSPEQQMVEARGLLEYWKYTEAFVARQAANPPDNYVGDLIRVSRHDESELSLHEVTNVVYGLLLAGHETTTSMSANAIVTLMRHRDAWERLCADPSLIPNAVEEVLRYDSSVITWRRRTRKPVEVGGVTIPEGANLLLALCSGNRDETHFPEPDRFDLDRGNARNHLSFGFGIHYCLGAPLARLELRVVLEEITRRMPSLRLVPDQRWEFSPNTSFRGPTRLLVEW
ncbi:MAG TPA: cytochrome P450 [Candidatus Binatia bacterium]